jgi:hypothetical protein
MGYTLFTLVFNRTHYESDGETLRVYTEPLPYFRYGKKSVEIGDIHDITVERPAYAPFPEGRAGFYNVYVHTLDGEKIQIAAYVNYDHAYFIAQELKAHLKSLSEISASVVREPVHYEMDQVDAWKAAERASLSSQAVSNS